MKMQITFKLIPTGKPYLFENPEPGSRLSPKLIAKLVESSVKEYLEDKQRQEWWQLKDFQAQYDPTER